ncbi:uncharacterized protein LOC143294590 isoform X2 [Babylonia areolata]|uniref:uncharacterized protein LOC143294590 isoform X2 n=1 Tax=Babylonia areolata TaxID=304850 RepID=UPI003FD615A3
MANSRCRVLLLVVVVVVVVAVPPVCSTDHSVFPGIAHVTSPVLPEGTRRTGQQQQTDTETPLPTSPSSSSSSSSTTTSSSSTTFFTDPYHRLPTTPSPAAVTTDPQATATKEHHDKEPTDPPLTTDSPHTSSDTLTAKEKKHEQSFADTAHGPLTKASAMVLVIAIVTVVGLLHFKVWKEVKRLCFSNSAKDSSRLGALRLESESSRLVHKVRLVLLRRGWWLPGRGGRGDGTKSSSSGQCVIPGSMTTGGVGESLLIHEGQGNV